MSRAYEISTVLSDLVKKASPTEREKLRFLLTDFREKSNPTYLGVKRQPFARNILNALEHAVG